MFRGRRRRRRAPQTVGVSGSKRNNVPSLNFSRETRHGANFSTFSDLSLLDAGTCRRTHPKAGAASRERRRLLRDSASRRRGRARRAVTTGRVAPRGRSAKDKAPRAPLRRGPPREGQARNAMGLPTDCPADCEFAAWRWTQRWFGDCVCTSRDAASFTLGLVSVFAWGVAELPQIVTNFRNGTSEGVSFAFVATWLTGDALNLIGCAVSPTLPTQLYTAIVYTSTTVVLIAQHVAYGRRGEAAKRRAEDFAAANEGAAETPASRRVSSSIPSPTSRCLCRRRRRRHVDRAGNFWTWRRPVCSSRPKRTPCGSGPATTASRCKAAFEGTNARSLSSARTFVSGSWTSNASRPNGIENTRVLGATTDESFTASSVSVGTGAAPERERLGVRGGGRARRRARRRDLRRARRLVRDRGRLACRAFGRELGCNGSTRRSGGSGRFSGFKVLSDAGESSSSFDSSHQRSESSGYAHAPLVPACRRGWGRRWDGP